jgi:hypothetical protein
MEDLFLMYPFKDQYGLNPTYRFTILMTGSPSGQKGVAVVRDFDDECAALEDNGSAPARDRAKGCSFLPQRPGTVV